MSKTLLPDEERDECRAIAGAFLTISEKIRGMQDRQEESECVKFLEVIRENLIDWAAILSPPGEPEDGYPEGENLAPVYSLDAYRARRKG